jgi:hypothetical protein
VDVIREIDNEGCGELGSKEQQASDCAKEKDGGE